MPAGDIFILVVKKTKSIRRAKSLMGKSWDYQKQISHDDIHKRGNQCQIHFKYVYDIDLYWFLTCGTYNSNIQMIRHAAESYKNFAKTLQILLDSQKVKSSKVKR